MRIFGPAKVQELLLGLLDQYGPIGIDHSFRHLPKVFTKVADIFSVEQTTHLIQYFMEEYRDGNVLEILPSVLEETRGRLSFDEHLMLLNKFWSVQELRIIPSLLDANLSIKEILGLSDFLSENGFSRFTMSFFPVAFGTGLSVDRAKNLLLKIKRECGTFNAEYRAPKPKAPTVCGTSACGTPKRKVKPSLSPMLSPPGIFSGPKDHALTTISAAQTMLAEIKGDLAPGQIMRLANGLVENCGKTALKTLVKGPVVSWQRLKWIKFMQYNQVPAGQALKSLPEALKLAKAFLGAEGAVDFLLNVSRVCCFDTDRAFKIIPHLGNAFQPDAILEILEFIIETDETLSGFQCKDIEAIPAAFYAKLDAEQTIFLFDSIKQHGFALSLGYIDRLPRLLVIAVDRPSPFSPERITEQFGRIFREYGHDGHATAAHFEELLGQIDW